LNANPAAQPVYGVAMRAWAAANQADSMRSVVQQWSRIAPDDETPFREWGAAALLRRDRATAREAYQLGRETLHKPDALAGEMAQLAVLDEDWPAAAREWAKAVRTLPGYRQTAISTLSNAPERLRPDLLRTLDKEGSPEARRLAVDLRARWGDPIGAFNTLSANLPPVSAQALDVLQQFLDQVRTISTPEALKAQGLTLEALADRWSGAPQKARLRLDAAKAYAAGGDHVAARRMLAMIAGDAANAPAVVGGASATLIGLLVDEGNLDEATKRLEEYRKVLPTEEYQRLARATALGWAQDGQAARGMAMLEADSTVEGFAARGRIFLYQGRLPDAVEALRAAGPFAGTRDEATERTLVLALLQPIEEDSLPALGLAFIKLDKGDSTEAAQGLEKLGKKLPPASGGAELLLLAGRIQAAREDNRAAEGLLRAAIVKDAPATAAAASLELGRLLIVLNRDADAVSALEQLILEYPSSALVPQARRLLDQARGAVPRT
jgi:hypothetical protein